MKFAITTLASLVTLFAADCIGGLPGPGEDMELTGGKPAEVFFRERRSNTVCLDRLNEARAIYSDADAHLKKLVSAGAPHENVVEAEESVEAQRWQLLDRVEECGECATRKPVLSPEGDRFFQSDGSCYVGDGGTEDNPNRYQRIRSLLLHIKHYPKSLGGFRHVLEFMAWDHQSGGANKEENAMKFPFFSFLSVKGGELFGSVMAFSYYIENRCIGDCAPGVGPQPSGTMAYTFQTVKKPPGFAAPDVFDVWADGQRRIASQIPLSRVYGMWYVASNGYIRYATGADFGISTEFISKIARRILLDTLLQVTERSVHP